MFLIPLRECDILILDNVPLRFLLTSSQPSYGIIMNGTLPPSDRNLSYVDSTLGVVDNGTTCNLDVCTGTFVELCCIDNVITLSTNN